MKGFLFSYVLWPKPLFWLNGEKMSWWLTRVSVASRHESEHKVMFNRTSFLPFIRSFSEVIVKTFEARDSIHSRLKKFCEKVSWERNLRNWFCTFCLLKLRKMLHLTMVMCHLRYFRWENFTIFKGVEVEEEEQVYGLIYFHFDCLSPVENHEKVSHTLNMCVWVLFRREEICPKSWFARWKWTQE